MIDSMGGDGLMFKLSHHSELLAQQYSGFKTGIENITN